MTDSSPGRPLVCLPVPPEQVGELPANLDYVVWDGEGERPAFLRDVTFYVPTYLGGTRVLEAMEDMPSLEVVQTLTAGVDDVLPLLPPNVTLCNARGVHDASTAELAVALLLAALRGIPDFVRAQERSTWVHEFRPALADRTVLILGYGSIGAQIEERLRAFEVDVLRVARSPRQTPAPVAGIDELPALLPRADAVVVVVPLTDATRGMVDAKFLAQLKDGSVLVNVARGSVVDTDALMAELQTGRISAALDVTDPEPLPDGHPLWSLRNVLITPHVGGNTTAFFPRAMRLLREQLARWAAGEPLQNVTGPRE